MLLKTLFMTNYCWWKKVLFFRSYEVRWWVIFFKFMILQILYQPRSRCFRSKSWLVTKNQGENGDKSCRAYSICSYQRLSGYSTITRTLNWRSRKNQWATRAQQYTVKWGNVCVHKVQSCCSSCTYDARPFVQFSRRTHIHDSMSTIALLAKEVVGQISNENWIFAVKTKCCRVYIGLGGNPKMVF